ncbi:MAG: aminotransferase class IV [Niabella sp.]|nr:aminotransferase class IV [Niabella sp.]
MLSLCYNGNFAAADAPVLHAGNKSYRYGDGFFETIRVVNSKIPLQTLHKNRIEKSLLLLYYELPVAIDTLFSQILELCSLNNCGNDARVRLSFSHGEGTLFEHAPLHYLIEATPYSLPATASGLNLGFYTGLKKEASSYSSLKLSSAFIYSRAAQYCTVQGWNDCLILNTRQQIIESVISNIFWIKNGVVATPPLTDGCIAGVFRSFLLKQDPLIEERSCTSEILKEADEIFLTNALRGIQSVQQLEERMYINTITQNRFCITDKNPFG